MDIVKIVPDRFERVLYLLFRSETTHFVKKVSLSNEIEILETLEIELDEISDLRAAFGGHLVIARIVDPSDLENQSFFIINFNSKKIEKSFQSARFEDYSNGLIHFRNINQKRVEQEMEIDETDFDFVTLINSSKINTQDETHKEIKNFIKETLNHDINGDIEYIEHNSNLILGVHSGVKKYESRILILDENKNMLENWIIRTEIEKLPSETFFVYGNFLIFVSHKSKLNFYHLS